jgi:hypothetical protein
MGFNRRKMEDQRREAARLFTFVVFATESIG